ncbi:MAG: MBL fold metallo-hydrolase [Clostridia bacterium]|nr:MBL fold metallo-hydrolase [Clostridia bacterium]
MKIQILGSGGGEGYPALFCGCKHCNAARKAGGKNLRSLSQTLIDGKLLIDLPADTLAHFRKSGLNLGDIEHILITHVHDDHYCPNLFSTRGTDFAHVMKAEKLNVYGNADVQRLFDGYYRLFPIRDEIRENIVFHTLKPFESEQLGDYLITPLKANHAPKQVALNYIIDDGKTALLYLLDSGYPTEETLNFIAKYPRKFSCVVMDCTMGVNYYVYHMNFEQNIQLKNKLLELQVANDDTRFIVSHITHNHAGLHEEVEEYFQGSGIEVSFDGLSLEETT